MSQLYLDSTLSNLLSEFGQLDAKPNMLESGQATRSAILYTSRNNCNCLIACWKRSIPIPTDTFCYFGYNYNFGFVWNVCLHSPHWREVCSEYNSPFASFSSISSIASSRQRIKLEYCNQSHYWKFKRITHSILFGFYDGHDRSVCPPCNRTWD